MNLKSKLAAAALMLGSVSMAQAASFTVEGLFTEPMAANDTLFTGTFDWDGTNLTGLTGDMNSSMMVVTTAPNLGLMGIVDTMQVGNIVTASVFLSPTSTDVFDGGGYDVSDNALSVYTGPLMDGNAFFSFQFDTTTMAGIVDTMTYGDCTMMGLMGSTCMTGKGIDMATGGTMRGFTTSLNIADVSAVPLPAAAWLFGGALISLFGANRRKIVLPA